MNKIILLYYKLLLACTTQFSVNAVIQTKLSGLAEITALTLN